MDALFTKYFSKQPVEIINGDYFYNADADGDAFDETDKEKWLNQNVFRNNWEGKSRNISGNFSLCNEICDKIASENKPFIDVACGPGMGLAPIILVKNPTIPCLATDACSMLIKAWRSYINENLPEYNISLASFSTLNIPIKDNSLDYVTSFIGIGSTRNGMAGQMQSLKEIYRVLKPGGYFITVEGEFEDMSKIDKVFALWGKNNWYRNDESWSKLWRDKFTSAGFYVESADKSYNRIWTKDDNDFAEAADTYGIEIAMRYNLYVLVKK